MVRIAPSILSFNPGRLLDPVVELDKLGVDRIHLDVMDGQFVPPITFGAELAATLVEQVRAPVEAHLMTLTPERHFDAFIGAGCKRIYFHAEASFHSHRLVQQLQAAGIEAGIAINPATPSSAIQALVDLADAVLVMTVNPGWGGQRLIAPALGKVREIRRWRPDVDIEVDGGIDPTTIRDARDAGANLFVVGSYLARSPSLAEGLKAIDQACS